MACAGEKFEAKGDRIAANLVRGLVRKTFERPIDPAKPN
jgi:hypothetical protein